MNFLYPIFLAASAAILVPIIVHLFNFRRPKRVAFSDISLVQEVKRSVVKRMRLRQLLLLLSRILIILALVGLFAGPVRRTEGTARVEGNSSIAIVVDNSYSMQGGNDQGSYWLQAQQIAREIVEAHQRTDEFLIMTTDEPKLNYNFGEQQASLKDIKELKISQNTQSLADLLSVGESVFTNASNQNRRLYFISDFQQSTVLPDTLLKLARPEGLEINLVPLTTRKLRNAYIAEHSISTQIIEKDKPVTLSLSLMNDSPEPVKNIGLRVVSGTENRPVATENLEAGEKSVIDITLIPKTAGWQSGYIEIDDYPVEYDNKRYFSYYVPYREKMLVVEETPVPNMRLMFGGEVLDQFDVKFVSYREFAAENLDQYKSIMLLGLSQVSTGMQEKLNAHLKKGGGILYFPGPNLSSASINAWFQSLQIGTFGTMVADGSTATSGAESTGGQYASSVDLDHPLFEGVYTSKGGTRKFDAPLVYQHYKFRTLNNVLQNTILKLPNQDPILVESRPENGLFYTFTMFPGESWTDLTIKSSGLALLVQLARVMNQSQQTQATLELGTKAYHRVKTSERDVIKMMGADKIEITPEQHAANGYIVLKFDKQKLSEGNYTLSQGDKEIEKISFNVPDAESKLAAHSEQELRDLLAAQGIEGINVTPALRGSFAENIRMQSEGVPLWKFFLIAALLFFVLEFVLLSTGAKTATA